MSGKVHQPFRLGWHQGWGLVLSAALEHEFAALAPTIALVPADLGTREKYLEVEIRTDGVVANMLETFLCPECGFGNRRLDGDGLVLRDLKLNLPLFRLRNYTAAIVAHEDLVPLVRRELGDQVELAEVDLEA